MKNNKKNLIKEFTELYLIEKKARDLYTQMIEEIKDKNDIKIIKSIKNDEEKHMGIAQDIISLLS